MSNFLKYLYFTLKISIIRLAVVGPSCVGKTFISEYYTEVTEKPDFKYYSATQIVRIYETERKIKGMKDPIPVQLYDLNGSDANEINYSKFSRLVDGIIIVLSAKDLVNLAKLVRKYYTLMGMQDINGKTNTNVIVLLHKFEHPLQDSVYIEDKQFSSIPVFNTCLEDQQEQIYDAIDSLVEKIAKQQDYNTEY